ncbi:MAG: hypothetical protein RL757_577 [Bacteroidota bacterium]|jgi:glycosyltransferase involved in cell wall biosynthesis
MQSNKIPISILIPTKNEAKNIGACLDAIANWADEIVLVDSKSTDQTRKIAESYGATVIEFDYKGGWPKKRQWAMDSYPFRNEWILLLDADEILLPAIKIEMEKAIQNTSMNAFSVLLNMEFLGKELKFAYQGLRKVSLLKRGKARYERRLKDQDASMADMEIHEHVVVEDNKIGQLNAPILHRNYNSMFHYIHKHNEYSNWEAKVFTEGSNEDLKPSFWGNQAQRRRWIKKTFLKLPFTSLFYFLYHYFFRLGFLDGKAGWYYCLFGMIQFIHIKAKIHEIDVQKSNNS